MGKKLGIGQIPAPVKAAMDAMPEISSRAIAALPHDVRNKAVQTLRNTLKTNFPSKHQEYIRMHDERAREWMANFMLDPVSGGSVAEQITTVSNTERKRKREVWLTEEEVRTKHGEKHYKLAMSGMPDRPIENNEALRAAGHKEYQTWIDIVDKDQAKQDKTRITTTTELTAEEATEVVLFSNVPLVWADCRPLWVGSVPLVRAGRRPLWVGSVLLVRADHSGAG